MTKIVFTLTALLLSVSAFSQSDFRDGYYITDKNDTIKGLIDFRGDVFNAKYCRFKSSSESPVKEFLPGQINSYRFIDSKLYVSKSVKIDQNDSTRFLECLIKGELTVYFLRNNDAVEYYFIEDKEGKINTMNNNDVIFKTEDDVRYAKKTNQYIGVLNSYFKDYPDLKKSLEKLPYQRKQIIEITRKYHEKTCSNGEPCIFFEKPNVKNRLKIGITGLFGTYTTKYGTTAGNNFDGDLKYFGGAIEIQSQMKPTNEKVLFNLRLAYNSMNLSGERTQYSNNSSTINYKANISDIKLNAGFSYVYPKYAIKPLIFAGPFAERLSFSNFTATYDNNTNYKMINPIKTYYCYGIYFGLGVEFLDHFKFSVAYDTNNKRTDLTYFYKKGFEYSLCYFF